MTHHSMHPIYSFSLAMIHLDLDTVELDCTIPPMTSRLNAYDTYVNKRLRKQRQDKQHHAYAS